MSSFFGRLFSSQSVLGIDIGTASLKIAELAKGKHKPRLLNYAYAESQSALLRPNTAFQTSSLKLFDKDIIELLRSVMQQMKPKTTRVIASLPLFSAFTTVITIPEMSEKELEETIAFQAKQYIPLPISEVAIDWSEVGRIKDEKGFVRQQILLVSVPQEHIHRYQEVMKAVGLTLEALEIEPLALIRALVGSDPTPSFIVDIGNLSTAIAVAAQGGLKLARQVDFAGASLTQAVSSSLGINPLRAEELKRERGIAGTGPNYELSTIMLPFVDAILNEVRRTEFDYKTQFPGSPAPERVVLSGGGANLSGIEKYAREQMGLPVVKGTPFMRFDYEPELEPLVPALQGPMSVAIGLALKAM